ncbi:RNA polymerase sigma factor [Agitococcus lubricus]|uniref:RNA polymerase sigma-70 factor (ECF subfamily) n=1 Tax=Agitococcus lubricus TaxID=1077255 RepID=A0A2T5IZ90_9GAMM|nr:RNA polymerase sigma factor [Agitococcus lubricus]PTQ89334.1 RNA polymerase sigma-70 factor (ECF subfamily) [Agitococcus lubricus]
MILALAPQDTLAYCVPDLTNTTTNMPPRPYPMPIDDWLKDMGRRGLVMAKLATQQADIAQDIVQDSLLAFISRYADRPNPEWTPLFYTILRSQIMDWKRQQARRGKWLTWLSWSNTDDDETIDEWHTISNTTNDDPAHLLANAKDIALVDKTLASLPLRQQQAFLLRVWEGLDIQTTAQVMACSESSVKTHYSRAIQSLRHALSQDNPV